MRPIIGVNLPPCQSIEQLQEILSGFTSSRFDSVEISMDAFP